MGSRVIYKTNDKNPNFIDIVVGCRSLFPGYHNIFEKILVKGSTVILQGYAVCSDEVLNNVRAIWIAEIIKDKVSLWHIYPDTEQNRERWGL